MRFMMWVGNIEGICSFIRPGKQGEEKTPFERRVVMTWAQRLKRVFDIDIETCSECGGDVRIIASIEDPLVI
jgi:hypothetical protein